MRKVITLTAEHCQTQGMSDFRQSAYNIRHLKRHMRTAQNKKRSKAASEEQKLKNAALIIEAHQQYIDLARQYLWGAKETAVKLAGLSGTTLLELAKQVEIDVFMRHAERQIDQIKRRVIDGETIPHAEKVFSIFQPHTEWISKGRAGVPVELGVKVCILEDQHQFILHHQVMENKTDDQVTVSMVVEAKARFAKLNVGSFDKGFHSPANQIALKAQLELAVLPSKGKPSKETRAKEQAPEFVKARRAHSAVESAINALEVHGLDRCPDHGIDGFKRYVALAVLARNIHRIGAILSERELARVRRQERHSERLRAVKLAI